LVAGLVVLAVFVDFGIYLLLRVILAWALVWLVLRSPDVPAKFKYVGILGYTALAVAYIPMPWH
jgi:hypothetical protein